MKLWRNVLALLAALLITSSALSPAGANIVISGSRVFTTAPGGGGGGTDPSWFTALADREGTYRGPVGGVEAVRQSGVGTSTFDDIFRAWNGGAFDQDSYTYCTGPIAGHTNYKGGEVYCYAVIAWGSHAAETWYQATTPSPAGSGGDGILADGAPKDTHSYDEMVAVHGEFWLGAMGSVEASNGAGSSRGWVWDLDSVDLPSSNTRGWTDLGLNTLDGGNDTGAVAYDPVTDKVFYSKRFTSGGTHQLASWNRSTKARTEHIATGFPNFGGSGGDMTAVVIYSGSDSVFMGIGDNGVRTIDLQDLLVGSTAWQAPTFAGVGLATGKTRVHFIAETNQLVTWEPFSNNLLVANVPANIHAGTFTWFRVALTGATITAPSQDSAGTGTNGTFGRFQIFRMPSGRLAVFLVNETNQQVYFAKLPQTPMSFAAEPVIRQLEEVWADAANDDEYTPLRLAA